MNNHCLTLLKVLLSGQFRMKGKQRSQIIYLAAMGVVGAVICIYSFALAFGMGMLGMPEVIPSYGVAIASLLNLVFTALKSNGILFAYKDYDMLMALPVKTSTIITSRFLTMYVWNLIFTILIMIPMGVGYVFFAAPGIVFYPFWLIGILVVPLIPMTFAALLGALIVFFSSRFRYANVANTVLSFAILIVILILSFRAGELENVNFSTEQMQSIGDTVLIQVQGMYPPAMLFHNAVVGESFLYFLLFSGISAGWYYLFAKLLGICYKRINTGLMTYHARSNYKPTQLKSSKPLTALWKKELKRFFTCTVYVINMGVGVVMALMFTAAICLMGIDKLETALQIPGVASVIVMIFPFVLSSLLTMTSTTSVSLSLEGKNLWIPKSLPVDTMTIYNSKILLDLTLKIPPGLLCSLLAAIYLPMENPWMTVMLFVTPVVYSAATAVAGMYVNLKVPNYEWKSETSVVKQSFSAMVGIFGGMINGMLPVLILLMLPDTMGTLVTIVFTCVEAAGTWLLYRHLKVMKY